MDWYYPVLTGALSGEAAKAAWPSSGTVRDGWARRPLRERRAVGHRGGDGRVRARPRRHRRPRHGADLLRWTRAAPPDDGSYFTGLVTPSEPREFPAASAPSYTAAAVILAADAIAGPRRRSGLFAGDLDVRPDQRLAEDAQRAGGGGSTKAPLARAGR